MLERSDSTDLIGAAWAASEQKTRLPEDFESFRTARGAAPLVFNTRRAYRRFFLRHRALLERGDARLGVYTKDISRQGIGILSPVQLFPKDVVRLVLPNGAVYQFEVARCRRLAAECYECGTRFAP